MVGGDLPIEIRAFEASPDSLGRGSHDHLKGLREWLCYRLHPPSLPEMVRCLASSPVPPLWRGEEPDVFAAERFVKNECDATCYRLLSLVSSSPVLQPNDWRLSCGNG